MVIIMVVGAPPFFKNKHFLKGQILSENQLGVFTSFSRIGPTNFSRILGGDYFVENTWTNKMKL